MSEFISKYIINHEAAMSEEWTDYDRFWTVSCLLLSFFGLVIAMLVRQALKETKKKSEQMSVRFSFFRKVLVYVPVVWGLVIQAFPHMTIVIDKHAVSPDVVTVSLYIEIVFRMT